MKIEVWHNIMWSRYKAQVFTELYNQSLQSGDEMTIYQIAETDSDRMSLSTVDKSVHQYPYVNLFRGSYSAIPKAALYLKLARLAFKSDADFSILAGYERVEFWIQLIILMLRRRKRVVFCDSTAYDRNQTTLKTVAKRLFFGNVDAALCYGKRSAEYARSFGVKAVFPRCQAAALPSDYRAADIPAMRLAHRSANGPVFLYVGRLSPEKRIDTLLSAFHKVKENCPTATLRIVGNGPQKAELIDLARSLGISNSAVFVGSKSDMALLQEYLGATCLVLPSWSEPWGLVVNEALHYGCPVLVSHRCGCVPELVEGSDCGQVFTCGDDDDLAAKMNEAILNYSDVERIAHACLARIAPFTVQAAATQIMRALVKV